MGIKYLPISWKIYHTLGLKLAASILHDPESFDQIVAISRGGLTLGHILSDFLRIRISTITIQSYTDIQTQGEVRVTEKLSTPIRGKRILLVDDVSDTGTTIIRAKKYLSYFRPLDITVVTMFYKPHSKYRPDYFARTTQKWILFPYEPTEMIMAISNSLQKEGKSKGQIQEFLKKLHYSDDQIAFTRKHYLEP